MIERYLNLRKFLLPLTASCLLFSCSGSFQKATIRSVPLAERSSLVVLNFKNNTAGKSGAQFEPWEWGLASMMITDLETIGLFNIVSSKDVLSEFRKRGLDFPEIETEDDMVKAGRIVSATYVLSGSFVETGGKLKIEGRVFSVSNGTRLGGAAVEGDTDDFFDLQKQLVLKIGRYLKAVLNQAEATAIRSRVDTRSVRASLNNYAGEIAVMRASEYREKGQTTLAASFIEAAKQNFKSAIAQDPQYQRAKKNLSELVMAMPITL